jgi:hypothetical protein
LALLGCAKSSEPSIGAAPDTSDSDAGHRRFDGSAARGSTPSDAHPDGDDAASKNAGSSVDAQSPWADCDGPRPGEVLSCASPLAREVRASRYDDARKCFEPATTSDALCAVPTNCPGGGGVTTCVIDPHGDAFAVYLLFGEDLGAPGFRTAGNAALDATVDSKQQALCDRMLQTLWSHEDEDAGVALDAFDLGDEPVARPACAPTAEPR